MVSVFPQCLDYVFTNSVTIDEDIWTVSSGGVHRLSRDCDCKGIYCFLSAL